VKIAKLFAISQQKGAETIVYLASRPTWRARPAAISTSASWRRVPEAQDDGSAKRLWTETEKITGLTW
jgi:hypothetical protein